MNKKIIIIICVVVVIIASVLVVFLIKKNHKRESAFLYEENGLYGLQDANGKKITPAKYKKIIKIDNTDTMFIINNDNKYGLLDSTGKIVLKEEYDDIMSDGYSYDYSEIGYILRQKKQDGNYFGYADYNGNLILKCNYEEISRVREYDGKDIYLIARENGRYGIYKNNKFITELKYQEIFYNDVVKRFIVQKNGKYGVLNEDGKEIIKPEHPMFGIEDGKIYFINGNRTIYYDANGNLINIVEKEKQGD